VLLGQFPAKALNRNDAKGAAKDAKDCVAKENKTATIQTLSAVWDSGHWGTLAVRLCGKE